MLKKIRELFKQYKEEKGQGVVEYALMLGFVAVLAIYMINNSNLLSDVKTNVGNADKVATAINAQYTSAAAAAAGGGGTTS